MPRLRWLAAMAAAVVMAAYLVYDWSRPCVQGPVHQFVTALLNGGHFAVLCAG